MIPFARIMTYGNTAIDNTNLLDIDFSNQKLGDTFITDLAGHTFNKVGSGTGIVTNDPTHGLVMTFDGMMYFSTPMVSDISLSQKHFEMRIVFKSTSNAHFNIPFCTGDYYTTQALVGGFELILYHNYGTQLFATTSDGTFTRCPFDYTYNTWADLTITWVPITKTMTIRDNGTGISTDYVIPAGFGNGSQLALGGSYVAPVGINSFVGSLKSIVIREIV